MTDHIPDAVFEGVASGLQPADLDLPTDAITIDVTLLRARERLRFVKAAEANVKVQRRIADAAERQATALEIIAGLLECVVHPVECEDGETRRTLRTYDRTPTPLQAYNS